MTKLFERVEGFPYLTWAEGFTIGLIFVLILSAFIPEKAPAIVTVPSVQVIEKPVVVNKPVYMSAHDRQQIQCLAENAYFEAGNQSRTGMIAVTNVVMNRVKDSRFPKTPCGVVYQRTGRVCQFSWVCSGRKRVHDMNLFAKTRKVAEDVYLANIGDVTMGSKFYHADYVNPRWNLRRVTKIGAHIFYRG